MNLGHILHGQVDRTNRAHADLGDQDDGLVVGGVDHHGVEIKRASPDCLWMPAPRLRACWTAICSLLLDAETSPGSLPLILPTSRRT